MVVTPSWPRKAFLVCNYVFLILLAVMCLLPLIHVLAISFSSNAAASAGEVKLWPVEFNLKSYEYVAAKKEFFRSLWMTLQRELIGTPLSMALVVLIAYPLSKDVAIFRSRSFYAWFFVLTILFSGGLVPFYSVVRATGLLDSIWALVLPGAVPVFSVVLLLNFFRTLPKELEEAAFIDGANQWTSLLRIYVPLSVPALATITLLTVVSHWNAWFDGLILMNSPANYPLQSYLQTMITRDYTSVGMEELRQMEQISDRTIKASQILLGALPILILYPFLQKYFVKGMVIGGVKE
ncbi:carbohydrate ABC transporter permease [Paenibacillus cymbidii]|uniref:carbohydrate ABC transporter permease n=1 Tax=Paenibacillus cymbidii TaxID=1639034 RepID=UPI00108053D9|nr:carbohydrate ABC transporter permease [Paenibacillus cymbidii]